MRSDESLVPRAPTFAICISMPLAIQKELQDLGGAVAANQPARLRFSVPRRAGGRRGGALGEGRPHVKAEKARLCPLLRNLGLDLRFSASGHAEKAEKRRLGPKLRPAGPRSAVWDQKPFRVDGKRRARLGGWLVAFRLLRVGLEGRLQFFRKKRMDSPFWIVLRVEGERRRGRLS